MMQVREYSSVAEMRAAYAAIRAKRFVKPEPVRLHPNLTRPRLPVIPEPKPAPRNSLVSAILSLQDKAEARSPTEKILDAVSASFCVGKAEIRGSCRFRNIATARQAFCFLALRHGGKSMTQIGKYLGQYDHTTVLHAVRKVQSQRESFEPMLSNAERMLTDGL